MNSPLGKIDLESLTHPLKTTVVVPLNPRLEPIRLFSQYTGSSAISLEYVWSLRALLMISHVRQALKLVSPDFCEGIDKYYVVSAIGAHNLGKSEQSHLAKPRT